MNALFKQGTRLGRLETTLGADALVLLRFDGSDYVNALFEYNVEALSTEANIDFDALIGTHASVGVQTQRDDMQWFDGIVTQARWVGAGENGHRYNLTLRPWLWVADQRRQQRIFHNKTAPQIVEEVFAAYAHLGKPHLDSKLSADYPELEYTVQYGESDMAFACRLMERFGISYHFTFATGGHTMVLTDAINQHDYVPGKARLYKAAEGQNNAEEEHFWDWQSERNLVTGAVRMTDYNFKTPTVAMEVDKTGEAAYAEGQLESYEYPGDYLDPAAGKALAAVRTNQVRGQDNRHRAIGDCASLRAGMLLTLTGDQVHGIKDQDYLCLSATHSYQSDAYGSGDVQGDDKSYSGAYVFMSETSPLASKAKTPRPKIHGPQTAMVVGEGEIDCDEFGRILVHFHWDLAKAHSMRCRVSQLWAGQGWGGIAIPRIGMEVVVEFLEGDPDKPIVTGCVYNAKTGMPYDLPSNKTRLSLKSQSHERGGFNEFRLEDAGGAEEIFMHAQKDHNTVIENDETHQILNDRAKSVTRDQTENIGRNKTIKVDKDHNEQVDGEKHETIKLDYSTTVTEGNQSVTVVAGTHTTTVKGDQGVTVTDGNQSTSVEKGDRSVSVGTGRQSTTVKGNIQTTSEDGAVVIKAATAIVLEAPDIILKSNGSNFITISQGSVVVEGDQTNINPRIPAPNTD